MPRPPPARASLVALMLAAAVVSGCGGGVATKACHYNGDCADGLACVSGSCQTGAAPCSVGTLSCQAAGDCPSKRCEAGCCAVACASSLDCASGESCKSGVCRAAAADGCASNVDCLGSPSSPFCLVGQKSCVACLKAADCGDPTRACSSRNACELAPGRCKASLDCAASADRRVCDPGATSCVQCLQNLDCAAGSTCGADQACHPGPTRCSHDADCTAGGPAPHCDPQSGRCVGCVFDTDCATDGTRRCNVARSCEQVPVSTRCHDDAGCATSAAGHRCRLGDGACVPCIADADCPGQRCLSDNSCGAANGCAASADCGQPTKVCRANDRTCVECAADGDCPGGRCSQSLCVAAAGCAVEADCAASQAHCRASDRTCVECLTRDQCGPLRQCLAAACAAGPCATDGECLLVDPGKPRCSGGACVACLQDSQCGSGRVCRQNACVVAGCGGDADCANTPATPTCRTDTRSCVACLADAGCPSGYGCTVNACAALPGLDGPCGANATCPAPLTCIQSSNTTIACRAPCDPLSPRCAAGSRCGLSGFDAQGRPTGACLPAGGGEAGAACSSSSRCQPDLSCLYDAATSGICRRACDLASPGATCPAPDACQPLVRLDAAGIPRAFGVCFPDTHYLDPCGTDASCDPGQVCSAGPDGHAPTALRDVCDWPVGARAATAACDADADCASGFCLAGAPSGFGSTNNATAGYCQGGCTTDQDCPSQNGRAGACANYPFSWANAQGQATVQPVATCVVQCKGEVNCRTDASCLPVPDLKGTAWVARCRPGNTASRSRWGGASCGADADCWSGTCLQFGSNTTDGLCLGVCDPAGSGDCGAPGECAPNGVLRTLPGPDGSYGTADDVSARSPLCWGRTCLKDADCAGQSADAAKPRVCGADVDPRNHSDILLTCSPREGAKRGGAACAADTECASDWCVSWTKGGATQKRCFGACQGASGQPSADCTSTGPAPTICSTQKLNALATSDISVCVPVFP